MLEHIGPALISSCRWAMGSRSRSWTPSSSMPISSDDVHVHQMHALHDRAYLHGAYPGRLHHVSYFLSHVTRAPFHAGTIDLVPNNFSEMRAILHDRTTDPLVLAAASLPDRHGYFSLGLNADYWRPSSAAPGSSWRRTPRCRGRSAGTRCT